jgi:hypothetical protein
LQRNSAMLFVLVLLAITDEDQTRT